MYQFSSAFASCSASAATKLQSCPQAVVKKVWRFDTCNIEQYDCRAVEAELVQLFPDVARKVLKFDLWYVDDLAGEPTKQVKQVYTY